MLGDFHLYIGNAQGTWHEGRVPSRWPVNSYSSRTRKSKWQVYSETCRMAYECSSAKAVSDLLNEKWPVLRTDRSLAI
jgi:hypothetical protein